MIHIRVAGGQHEKSRGVFYVTWGLFVWKSQLAGTFSLTSFPASQTVAGRSCTTMAASLRPTDPHENAFRSVSDRRHYLGHRARFPSLTEFPDSPSVYSHAYHSPDADVHSDTASFSRLSGPPDCLECDDETASTIRSLSTEDVQDDSDIDDCTDDASHRISLQGPKIRFHSRAPWEIDDVIPPGEESDNSSKSATIGTKLKGKASRADNLIRTFARGSFTASRPSVDSARSQVSATSSFEITAGNYSGSRGAL